MSSSKKAVVTQSISTLAAKIHQDAQVSQSRNPNLVCGPREDYRARAERLLEEVLATKPFDYPPKDMVRENADYQAALEPTEREVCKGFDLDFVETNVDEHVEYWKPFTQRVQDEKIVLNCLKQSAFERMALRQEFENQIIKLRMGISQRKKLGMSIAGGKEGFEIFTNTQAKLDREIAEIHSEWKSRLINLNKLTERAFWSENRRAEFKEAAASEKRRREAPREEHERLMAMMGWGGIPYSSEPETMSLQNTTPVPAWFITLDEKGTIQFRAEMGEIGERYKELIGSIVLLKQQMEEDAKANASSQPPPEKFKKRWHNAGPDWPYQSWREKGGWWVCRTGPGASLPEKTCPMCNPKRDTRPASQQVPHKPDSRGQPENERTAAERYNEIMSEVEKAMSQQMEKDKQVLRMRMRNSTQCGKAGNGTRVALDRHDMDEGYSSR